MIFLVTIVGIGFNGGFYQLVVSFHWPWLTLFSGALNQTSHIANFKRKTKQRKKNIASCVGGLKAVGLYCLTPKSESHLASGGTEKGGKKVESGNVWREERKGREETDEIR